MRRVILLAYYYLPETTSGVQRAVRLANYLPQHGYATSVVSAATNAAKQLSVNLARMVQRVLPYNEQLPWTPHAIAGSRRLISEGGVAAVISTSPPAGTHFSALYLKKRYGLKWVADFRDPLLGNPGRPRAWAQPYDRALERWIFRNADAIIGVTDAVVEDWRRRYPRWSHKFHLIWNGFDPADGFGPLPIPERPYAILAHVGVLYVQRHPTALIASLDRLVRQGLVDPARLRVRFTGPIPQQAELEAPAAAASLIGKGCLEIHPGVIPRDQAMTQIATADYLLLIDIVNLSNAGYTVPAKIFDYVLIGRPILAITDPNSPVDRILQKAGIPYACLYHNDSEADLDRKLADFLRLPNTPVSPSAWFFENFDGARQAGQLAVIIDRLITHS